MKDLDEQVTNQLFANLMAVNSSHVELSSCNFSRANMSKQDKLGESAEGSSRVALYHRYRILHCYTLECNYVTGKVPLTHPVAAAGGNRRTGAEPLSPERPAELQVKYTPSHWKEVGRASLCALLDLACEGHHPWSRIRQSSYRSFDNAR